MVLALLAVVVGASNLQLEVHPGRARPGDAVMLTLHDVEKCPPAFVGDHPVKLFEFAGGCRGLLALPVEQPPGELYLRVQTSAPDAGAVAEPQTLGTLDVYEPNFNVRELTVSSKFVEPPASVKKRMNADRKAFERAFAQKWSPPRFKADFAWPRQDAITAPFGDLRTFNGKKQSQHYGTDIDGKIGAPVHAANDGIVVMARDNYAAGQTVVLHHGVDLYTTYFHLSKIEVKQGQKVKRGDLIGKVGKSGRVTGPHLHFGVKVGGLYADPESLLRLSFEH